MMNSWQRVQGVNKLNYTELCLLFIAAPANVKLREDVQINATERGKCLRLAIGPQRDPQQWAAWKRYFNSKKIMWNFVQWVERNPMINMSVPSPWPDQFDEDYQPKSD